MRQLCERKGVEIIEAEACKDHIHMLVSIPPKLGVSSFVGYLKGKSSLMIFDRHANLKYRYGNRKFWCKGFYVDTVGRNKKVIENYIRNQLQEDIVADQISMEEYLDPFTGEKNKKVIENYIRNQLQEDIVADWYVNIFLDSFHV
ncbi:IS605/IS200-like transposase [Staphylococcus aureus]|nr:IS605/IS200-like transposase [Staphylococcus aureus]CXX56744.1 IS605/IS200-like transposase [Staphylococcus aureus]